MPSSGGGGWTEIFARTITVYLVDVHPIAREGLARAIDATEDLIVVGQIGSAAGALAETKDTPPDIVLVDLDTPDRDGIELVIALRAQLFAARVLLLSPADDELRVAEALRAGAHGYLLESSEPREIIESIRGIFAGGAPPSAGIESAVLPATSVEEIIESIRRIVAVDVPLSADIASAVLPATPEQSSSQFESGLELLTAREHQVLRLLLLRLPPSEICARLDMKPKTLEAHRIRIHAKCRSSNVEEMTMFVHRWPKRGAPPAAAAALALGPGPRPPSLVDAVAEPEPED